MGKLYIFGASKLGEIAFELTRGKYQVIGFIDNDKNKHGQSFCGVEVLSPMNLKNSEVEVLIASSYWKEIEEQLIEMNVMNYQILQLSYRKPSLQTSKLIDDNLQSVSSGALIRSTGNDLFINDITFLNGGSTAMDYFFLKAVAIKQKTNVFLEIGTWTGESISSIAEVAKRCYSISLPDTDPQLAFIFDSYCNKSNFSRYFSKRYNNIQHFEENSHEFDYDQIVENIDLVFIDGDHSYQGIKKDTMNIFDKSGFEDTIVIWHDFKTLRNELVLTTYSAVLECIPKRYLNNLFSVQGTYCGIYIPNKYKDLFQIGEKRTDLYSYKVQLRSKLNQLNEN